jgi:hypothetical protein
MKIVLALLCSCLAASAFAKVPVAPVAPDGPEAAILYFRQDGMVDYRIDGPRGIYLLSQHDGWFYLKPEGDCPRLAASDSFGVETGPQGRLDRYSAIIVQGWRCQLASVVRSPMPPGWRAKHL